MRYFVLTITICVLLINICAAQSLFRKWRNGVISYSDGSIQKAELYFDLKNEQLQARTGDAIKTFTPKDIQSFKIESRDSVEEYYSLPFDLSDENGQLVFFQVLRQFENFWLLSKRQPEVNSPSMVTQNGIVGGGSYQPEVLFLLTNDGKVNIYSSDDRGITKASLFGKNKSLNLGIDLLETLTTPHFGELKDYAYQMFLNFDKRKDLLKILDYYKTLIQ